MPIQPEDIKSSISCIAVLCTEIPKSVPIGNKRSKIHLVMTGNKGEDAWHTFNKRFDVLFAEDCRDGQGRLHHIRRGEFGMDLVVQYLSALDLGSLPLDLVAKKLDRLEAELEIISPKRKQTKFPSPLTDNKASLGNSKKPAPSSKPIKPKPAATVTSAAAEDDPKDKDFIPPRYPRPRSESPIENIPLDKYGNEIVEDLPPTIEYYQREPKRKAIIVSSGDNSESDNAATDKSEVRHKLKPKAKRNKTNKEGVVAVRVAPSSGDESDGLTALKAVEDVESGGGKRGPPSVSRIHWHPPIKHMEPGSKTLRWKFRCRYCNKTRTVERTPKCDDFDNEKPQPKIGNLSTHTRTEHPNEYARRAGIAQESLTNPLPSDTTVRNALAKIYIDLHGEVVRELSDKDLEGVLNSGVDLSEVKMLRAITKKICSSPQRRKQFRLLSEQVFGSIKAPRPSNKLLFTRWNYTHAMIKRALLLRKAVDKWVFERDEMRDLLLSDREWKFLEQLGSVLEIFTRVTFQMSRSKTPTLPWAIPMYRHMQESLHANLADSSLPPRMHRAVKKGLAKLGHYYDLAKLNHFNIIATVCHPALRLSWFKSIDSDSYDRAKEVFEYHLQEYQATATPEPAAPQPASGQPVEPDSFLASIARRSSSSLVPTVTPTPASEFKSDATSARTPATYAKTLSKHSTSYKRSQPARRRFTSPAATCAAAAAQEQRKRSRSGLHQVASSADLTASVPQSRGDHATACAVEHNTVLQRATPSVAKSQAQDFSGDNSSAMRARTCASSLATAFTTPAATCAVYAISIRQERRTSKCLQVKVRQQQRHLRADVRGACMARRQYDTLAATFTATAATVKERPESKYSGDCADVARIFAAHPRVQTSSTRQ
ncbi:hypothetical protein EDB85DRAFT_1894233 [Lactarius pseudohatsudake]|nr:hypothetical protein EDB85DRAFT_1894233 [Lactarius pseudohatsudake]